MGPSFTLWRGRKRDLPLQGVKSRAKASACASAHLQIIAKQHLFCHCPMVDGDGAADDLEDPAMPISIVLEIQVWKWRLSFNLSRR